LYVDLDVDVVQRIEAAIPWETNKEN